MSSRSPVLKRIGRERDFSIVNSPSSDGMFLVYPICRQRLRAPNFPLIIGQREQQQQQQQSSIPRRRNDPNDRVARQMSNINFAKRSTRYLHLITAVCANRAISLSLSLLLFFRAGSFLILSRSDYIPFFLIRSKPLSHPAVFIRNYSKRINVT